MVELTRRKTMNGYYTFTISTNEGFFDIAFENNLDLYWYFRPTCSIMDSNDSYKLTITKENYEIYREFEIIYNSIKNKTPFVGSLWNEEIMHKVFDIDKYSNEKLFQDNKVNWHSDEFCYENASYVAIDKVNECYIIEFHKSQDVDFFNTFSIRFRNSGSRYAPYNTLFMNMYNNLKKYNYDFHQIHIEEYIYSKKLTK